jgi:hypothetical protein
MLEKPKFIQGVFPFQGKGLATPRPLTPETVYKVPTDKRSQLVYFRAGNSSSELIYFAVLRDGSPMRYFPVGAKSAVHIPLAVVEDLHPGTLIEVSIAAPQGVMGEALLDIGFMEF